MQINADLRVGSLEESITVTGDAPVVDVQSTQRTHVLNRDLLDALPSARNYSGLAALMPGVRMSNTDVGGNQQMEQIYMTRPRVAADRHVLQVDGLQLNSLMNDGQVQAYFSDAANAEVSYQTSGVGADVSGGGVRINMIPKEGGNRVSGSALLGRHQRQVAGRQRQAGAQGAWSRRRRDGRSHLRLQLRASAGRSSRTSCGTSRRVRRIATNEFVANNFFKDGTQGMEDQWIHNPLFRLTWQITPKNKFTAYYDRYPKFKGHEMGALGRPGNGGGAARLAARALLHRPGEVDVDRHQPPAPRGRLLDQRRVPVHRLPARRAEGPRDAGLVHTIGQEVEPKLGMVVAVRVARGTAARRPPTASTRRSTSSRPRRRT